LLGAKLNAKLSVSLGHVRPSYLGVARSGYINREVLL